MLIETFVIVALFAFICEWIDSALGMGYGTILSPLLIIAGFPPLLVVPSILVSQALGGFSASLFHQKHKNVSFDVKSKNPGYIISKIKKYGLIDCFRKGISEDLKTVIVVTSLGVLSTIFAVLVAINISRILLNTYIAILVLLIGILLISGFTFKFSLRKMFIVGIVSSFNKGMSGGGFGPVVTGGQIVSGQNHKKAIGCTTLAEAPICIVGFFFYLITNSISSWSLPLALCIGAILSTPFGALTTKKIRKEKIKIIVAVLAIILGIWTLLKTYNLLPF
jgi:uncharacterized membrane protein YfcA